MVTSAARSVVLLALVTLAPVARADATPDPTPDSTPPVTRKRADKFRVQRLLAVGGAITVYAISETVAKPLLTRDDCVWCSPNGLDDGVRDALVWDDREAAHAASNLTGFVLAPLGATGLLLASALGQDETWSTFADDMIVVLEAAAYSQIVVQAIKFAVSRERPYSYYGTVEIDPDRRDENLSFLSGHSALVFSIAVSAGVVAHQREYKLEPVIWATGLGLAATTAYLRIGADRHYFTDVMAGSLLGATAGLVIPMLTGSLGNLDSISVAPTPGGVALSGTF